MKRSFTMEGGEGGREGGEERRGQKGEQREKRTNKRTSFDLNQAKFMSELHIFLFHAEKTNT